jgi:LemA protein
MVIRLVCVGIAVLVGWLILTWNLLVRLRQHVRESWSGVETELRRRHDLIPNLVAVVEAAAAHERRVLGAVTAARARAIAQRPDPQAAAERDLVAATRALLAIAEANPQLQADRGFADLQAQLAETEDRIQAARRLFNANVREFNTRLQTYPAKLVAAPLGFRPDRYCEFEAVIRKVVSVSFAGEPVRESVN